MVVPVIGRALLARLMQQNVRNRSEGKALGDEDVSEFYAAAVCRERV